MRRLSDYDWRDPAIDLDAWLVARGRHDLIYQGPRRSEIYGVQLDARLKDLRRRRATEEQVRELAALWRRWRDMPHEERRGA